MNPGSPRSLSPDALQRKLHTAEVEIKELTQQNHDLGVALNKSRKECAAHVAKIEVLKARAEEVIKDQHAVRTLRELVSADTVRRQMSEKAKSEMIRLKHELADAQSRAASAIQPSEQPERASKNPPSESEVAGKYRAMVQDLTHELNETQVELMEFRESVSACNSPGIQSQDFSRSASFDDGAQTPKYKEMVQNLTHELAQKTVQIQQQQSAFSSETLKLKARISELELASSKKDSGVQEALVQATEQNAMWQERLEDARAECQRLTAELGQCKSLAGHNEQETPEPPFSQKIKSASPLEGCADSLMWHETVLAAETRANVSERLLKIARNDLAELELELRKSKAEASTAEARRADADLAKSHAVEQSAALRKELGEVTEKCSELQLRHTSTAQTLCEREQVVGELEVQLEESTAFGRREQQRATANEAHMVSVQRELTDSLGENYKLQQRASKSETMVETLTAQIKELKQEFANSPAASIPGNTDKHVQASSSHMDEPRISSMLIMYIVVSVLAFFIFR